MLVGMMFLQFFANFIKMCSPPSVGSTKLFPYPNWLQNHHLWEGISALCCANYTMFCRVSGKWPTFEALFGITSALACILKQIFIFSVLTLPFFLASFADRHFSLRLHGSRPSFNGMLKFADHKRSRQA